MKKRASSKPLDPIELVRELVASPGPPGGEEPVRRVLQSRVSSLGYESTVDAKGNLLVRLPGGDSLAGPRIVVTAHLDELALLATRIDHDGRIDVTPLGGVFPGKWGEQPVEILLPGDPLPGILSFGSMHTASIGSNAHLIRTGGFGWQHAYVFTGLSRRELHSAGVRPGQRVVLARCARIVHEIGDHVASYFLDDRADLAAWLLALESLRDEKLGSEVLFAATTAEEVGGEGAQYLLHRIQPEICLALEIGPSIPESPFFPDEIPTIWVTDSYSTMHSFDGEILADVCRELGFEPHWQILTRGGSDASCAAAKGLTARPVTLGFPVENSHGLEIMHKDAVRELARLTVAWLKKVA